MIRELSLSSRCLSMFLALCALTTMASLNAAMTKAQNPAALRHLLSGSAIRSRYIS